MRRKTRLAIAGGVVVAALVFLLVNGLRHFTEYYLTVPQVVEAGPQIGSANVSVAGVVLGKTVHYDAQKPLLSFQMKGGGKVLNVVYRGVEPDTFGAPDVQAIADGHLEHGVFVAQHLLMKCPSHYQPATPLQNNGKG